MNQIAGSEGDICDLQKQLRPREHILRPGLRKSFLRGDYIKQKAQAGEMKEQLIAVGIKKSGEFVFRAPTTADEEAVLKAEAELKRRRFAYREDPQFPQDSFHLLDPDRYDLQLVNEKITG